MTTNLAKEITDLKDEFSELVNKISAHQMATTEDINELLTMCDSLKTNLSRLSMDAADLDKDQNDMNSKWMFQKLVINWWKNFNVSVTQKFSIAFMNEAGWLCNKINVHITNLIIDLDDDCIADLRKSVNYKELDENAKTEYSNSCFINDTLKTNKEIETMIHHDLDQATFDKESTKIYRSEYELNKAIIRCKEIRLQLLSKVKKDKEEQAVLKEIAEKEAAYKASQAKQTAGEVEPSSETKSENK